MNSLTDADIDINDLCNHPRIQQLQDIMAQKPALIQSLLEQFAAENPEIQEETLTEGKDDDSSLDIHTPEERKAIDQMNVLMIYRSRMQLGSFKQKFNLHNPRL